MGRFVCVASTQELSRAWRAFWTIKRAHSRDSERSTKLTCSHLRADVRSAIKRLCQSSPAAAHVLLHLVDDETTPDLLDAYSANLVLTAYSAPSFYARTSARSDMYGTTINPLSLSTIAQNGRTKWRA